MFKLQFFSKLSLVWIVCLSALVPCTWRYSLLESIKGEVPHLYIGVSLMVCQVLTGSLPLTIKDL